MALDHEGEIERQRYWRLSAYHIAMAICSVLSYFHKQLWTQMAQLIVVQNLELLVFWRFETDTFV